MQNPDELIMLFENPSSKHTHILRQTSASSHTHTRTHTHTQTHTGTCGMLPPCMTCSCLSPPIPSSFRFTGREEGKKKEMQKKRQLEERDEGEERMCLFRRSADMKQVSPVNFSAAIPPSLLLPPPPPLLPLTQSHLFVFFVPRRPLFLLVRSLVFSYLGHAFFCFPAGVQQVQSEA